MAVFPIPASPKKNALVIDKFVGVDFTNDPSSVSQLQTPNAVNMIRDVPGKIRKCMGYHTIDKYDGRINGFHRFNDKESVLHAGNTLYYNDDAIYFGMLDEKSRSWKCGDKLVIADGNELVIFDGTDAYPASEDAYIPTVTISKSPDGGGTSYEELNLIQPGFKEMFLGTESDTAYHLTFNGLDKKKVTVSVLNENGEWIEKTEGTDYSVDHQNGIINFVTAPGKSPVTGEDNVKIEAYRTIDGYAEQINHCTIGTPYGVNGAKDRLFLSGNEDYINRDWFSQQNDPTYWPDINYAVIGSDRSRIVGYSILNNRLATHKDENEEAQSIVLRSGELTDDKVFFRIVGSLQAEAAIAVDSFDYLKTEPVYLTRQGIHAVTTPDSGEKYSQNRSFYLDGKLLAEKGLETACSAIYDDMYWLCLNGVAYILDGLQQLRTDASEPYSTRQYAGFYRTNIPARIVWSDSDNLYFGTENGEICEFYKDKDNPDSYKDNGVPVTCFFETPELSGSLFYKKKTFSYLAARLQDEENTSVKIETEKNGSWVTIKDTTLETSRMRFSDIDFDNIYFGASKRQKMVTSKLRLKKMDKAKFRFSNFKAEPFEVFEIGLEYTQSGNIK